MEAIRQIIDGNTLKQVVSLPLQMHDVLLEITVKPVDNSSEPKMTRSMLRKMLVGSHTQSLSVALPFSGNMTDEELRTERLLKHECAD